MAEEVRRLKLEIGIPELEYKSYAGMGPAASKVYYVPKGLSIGGYGEVVFSHFLSSSSGEKDFSDLQRIVLYAGYRFSPRIVFNAEFEFEHASTEGTGAVSVEFAYLDFLLSDVAAVRAGLLLVPIGFINEMHEPPFFHGVFRPELETRIIPATWSDIGVGLHGEVQGLRYKAYLLNGLNATAGEGFSADSWIREGRTGGSQSIAENLAFVLNLAYDLGPASFGGTIYRGRSGQGEVAPNGSVIHGDILLGEIHAGLAWRGVQLRGIYTVGTLGDADLISATLSAKSGQPPQVIGSRVRGGYLEAAYDLLTALAPGGEQSLSAFVRVERLNLHDQVPGGGVQDPALDFGVLTAGLTYKPLPTVVLKADYQRKTQVEGSVTLAEQVNVGAGFVF